jgi:hypothetical protein
MKRVCGKVGLILLDLWQKVDDAGLLDLLTVLTEIAFGFETPVQRADDPILQSLNVELDFSVDLLVPEVRDTLEVGDECIDSVLAKLSDPVDRFLEVHLVMLHKDRDEVVGIVATGLFDVVGEDVLKMGS